MDKDIIRRYLMTVKCPNCLYDKAVIRVHADNTLTAQCTACKEPHKLRAERKV